MKYKVGVGVAVFIVRDDGKFLMGKRQNAHGHDTWSIPGGWMEFGESWSDSAKREVIEETGLTISEPIEFVAATNNYFPDDQQHSNTIWLKTKYIGGEPKITEPDKFIEQAWFNLDSLPDPLFKPWHDLLKQNISLDIK